MTDGIKRMVGTVTPLVVLGAGILFAALLRGLPLTRPRGFFREMKTADAGGTSPLKSLALALAGTLGVGNIVGVSSAIAMGGFGAIFWMWISALAAMFLKYAEVTLAMNHREICPDGSFRGGAPYYIRDRLSRLVPRPVALGVAILFAVLCILNALMMGCVIQANAAASAIDGAFGLSPAFTGGFLAILGLALSVSGRKAITAVTGILVPLMSALFVLLATAVLIRGAHAIPTAFGLILGDAFRADSAVGGVFGFLISRGIRFGTIRGIISNEAGCGTSPTAHAASSCKSPVEQGFLGVVEVFVDTILLCTVTALVVILRFDDVIALADSPMAMTLAAFTLPFGSAGAFIGGLLAVAILCFGFATMLCWAHYANESLSFILRAFSKKERENATAKSTSSLLFLIVFFACAVWGASAAPALLWSLTVLITGIMTLLNTAVLLLSQGEIYRLTALYFNLPKKPFTRP